MAFYCVDLACTATSGSRSILQSICTPDHKEAMKVMRSWASGITDGQTVTVSSLETGEVIHHQAAAV